jgi:hypothetical protein
MTEKQITASASPPRLTYNVYYQELPSLEPDSIRLRFEVLEHSGVLTLPVPYWFRHHTWKRTEKYLEGKIEKVKTEDRNFWSYVDAVLKHYVAEYLAAQDHKNFVLTTVNQ